ncbi:hypothetical protein DMH08_38450 [Actinomadura sp. WAC 06369]|nr:hypothetical protein DMH08_38450 [Actinomadura sp. WAC 06369]
MLVIGPWWDAGSVPVGFAGARRVGLLGRAWKVGREETRESGDARATPLAGTSRVVSGPALLLSGGVPVT